MKKKMDAQKAKLAEMRKELRKAGLRGLLDPYGMTSPPGVAYNPSQGPKTWAGAFFGLLSYGIVGALYYLYVSSFIDPNNFTKVTENSPH